MRTKPRPRQSEVGSRTPSRSPANLQRRDDAALRGGRWRSSLVRRFHSGVQAMSSGFVGVPLAGRDSEVAGRKDETAIAVPPKDAAASQRRSSDCSTMLRCATARRAARESGSKSSRGALDRTAEQYRILIDQYLSAVRPIRPPGVKAGPRARHGLGPAHSYEVIGGGAQWRRLSTPNSRRAGKSGTRGGSGDRQAGSHGTRRQPTAHCPFLRRTSIT